MRRVGNAIDSALQTAECKTCHGDIAGVDGRRDKKTGRQKGGVWVHIGLPDTVHVAIPKDGTVHARD